MDGLKTQTLFDLEALVVLIHRLDEQVNGCTHQKYWVSCEKAQAN